MTTREDMRWLLDDSDLTAEQIGAREWIIHYVNQEGEWCGVIELHEKPDGTICGGSVMFALPVGAPAIPRSEGVTPHWHVDHLEPLTISPSVLCSPELGGCGHHGFIQQGRWVGDGSEPAPIAADNVRSSTDPRTTQGDPLMPPSDQNAPGAPETPAEAPAAPDAPPADTGVSDAPGGEAPQGDYPDALVGDAAVPVAPINEGAETAPPADGVDVSSDPDPAAPSSDTPEDVKTDETPVDPQPVADPAAFPAEGGDVTTTSEPDRDAPPGETVPPQPADSAPENRQPGTEDPIDRTPTTTVDGQPATQQGQTTGPAAGPSPDAGGATQP